MGTLLTYGPYAPNLNVYPPSQTCTVTIPVSTQKGRAQLAVAHFALIGASLMPLIDIANVTLNIM